MKGTERLVLKLKQQLVAEGDVVLVQQLNRLRPGTIGRRELAHLVELAIVGQVGFRDHAQQLPARDHGSAIE